MTGTTPNLKIPYAEPGDRLADYPTTSKSLADLLESMLLASQPNIPWPGDTYVASDQTITATANNTETPTKVRNTAPNPHPTRRLLVRVTASARMVISNGANTQLMYLGVLPVSGSSAAIPATEVVIPGDTVQYNGQAEAWCWVNPGATGTFGLYASKNNASPGAYVLRYAHCTVTPIRYQ